jgi:hypothetical protein
MGPLAGLAVRATFDGPGDARRARVNSSEVR